MDSSESTDIVYLTHPAWRKQCCAHFTVVTRIQAFHYHLLKPRERITVQSYWSSLDKLSQTEWICIIYIQSVAMLSCCILCCSSFSLTLLQACIVSSNIFSIDSWLLYKQTMRSIDWPVSLPDPWRASDRTQIGYRLAVQAMHSICHSVHNLLCHFTARGVRSC